MKLGDFGSVVQLGVGLHAGTAFLESLVELGGLALTRRLSRLERIAGARAARDVRFTDAHDIALNLLADLEVRKVQFFKDYRKVLQFNTGIAIGLAVLLCAISFDSDEAITWPYGALFCALSLAPAPASLLFLWRRWRSETSALVEAIEALDRRLLG